MVRAAHLLKISCLVLTVLAAITCFRGFDHVVGLDPNALVVARLTEAASPEDVAALNGEMDALAELSVEASSPNPRSLVLTVVSVVGSLAGIVVATWLLRRIGRRAHLVVLIVAVTLAAAVAIASSFSPGAVDPSVELGERLAAARGLDRASEATAHELAEICAIGIRAHNEHLTLWLALVAAVAVLYTVAAVAGWAAEREVRRTVVLESDGAATVRV